MPAHNRRQTDRQAAMQDASTETMRAASDYRLHPPCGGSPTLPGTDKGLHQIMPITAYVREECTRWATHGHVLECTQRSRPGKPKKY